MTDETTNENNLPVKKQVIIPSDIEAVLINGDLSKLTPAQRVNYYRLRCEELGVNPLSRPFDYLSLNGKLVLYGNKNLTDQLRANSQVSISEPNIKHEGGLFIVTVTARDKFGREDADMGVVPTAGASGEKLANAMMKAITKAKRRVTLSLCAAGCLDESELETVEGAKKITVDHDTGALLDAEPANDLPEQSENSEQVWNYSIPFQMKNAREAIKRAGAQWIADAKVWRSGVELPNFAQFLVGAIKEEPDPQVDPIPQDDVPEWLDGGQTHGEPAPKPAAKKSQSAATLPNEKGYTL